MTPTTRAMMQFVLAVLYISIVDTTAKAFTDELHGVQLVWGYFVGIAISLVVYFTISLARGKIGPNERAALRPKNPKLQLLRTFFLAFTVGTLFMGLAELPIAEATAISFLSPLMITALSAPILKERVGIHRWTAVLVGFMGVLIIVRPGSGIASWAALLILVSAFSFACFQISTRILSYTDASLTTLLVTGLGGLFWTSLAVPFFWSETTTTHWLVFLGTGALGAGAHLHMINAFKDAEASVLAPMAYTKLIWVTILGYVLFDDFPSLNTWIGSALIIAGGLYIVYREQRFGRVKPVPAK